MEFCRASSNVYYLSGAVNIGIITDGQMAVLVDSGLDDSSAKKIINALKNEGIEIKAVINTHSHADHCGGNSYIKGKTEAKIYASEMEEGIIEYPFIEPMYLFCGANPVQELKNKFFMAKPSHVDYIIKKDELSLSIESIQVNIVPLPGHSPNQIGIEKDGVLFCADSFISKEFLSKHGLPFNFDIEKHRHTLNFLKSSNFRFYIPAHSTPSDNISDTIDANVKALDEIDNSILEIVSEKKTTEQILKEALNKYHYNLGNIGQYCLLRSALTAHLSYLSSSGRIRPIVADNLLLWEII